MRKSIRGAAAMTAVLLLGACTADPAPAPTTQQSPAQPVVQDEVVPMGFYRKPKDGEICKKLDPAPLKAVFPAIVLGPSTGVFQGRLKCDFTTNTPSLVSIDVGATTHPSTDAVAKVREELANRPGGLGSAVTLPRSKVEAFVNGSDLAVFDQNMVLYTKGYVADKAMATPRLVEAVQQVVDEFVVLLRKEFQSTTGPTPTAHAVVPKVVSPDLVGGRMSNYVSQYFEIMDVLRVDVDRLDPSPAVAQMYSTAKAENVLILAATLAVIKTEAQIDATLTRLAAEGITMSQPVSRKPDEFTEFRCGEGKIKAYAGALCLWRDKDSIGVAIYIGQKPADVMAEFVTLRDLVVKG